MFVSTELTRLLICELNQNQVVTLREKGGNRELSIVIGIFEASMIDRRWRKFEAARPFTHDILCRLIDVLGGKLVDVRITHTQEATYFAVLRIERAGELIEIDCRPSDALVVAMSHEPAVEIFVADDLLVSV